MPVFPSVPASPLPAHLTLRVLIPSAAVAAALDAMKGRMGRWPLRRLKLERSRSQRRGERRQDKQERGSNQCVELFALAVRGAALVTHGLGTAMLKFRIQFTVQRSG
jgi:hypothetical protein